MRVLILTSQSKHQDEDCTSNATLRAYVFNTRRNGFVRFADGCCTVSARVYRKSSSELQTGIAATRNNFFGLQDLSDFSIALASGMHLHRMPAKMKRRNL